jgi:hypothetical protein
VVRDWSGRPDAKAVAPIADDALLDEFRQVIRSRHGGTRSAAGARDPLTRRSVVGVADRDRRRLNHRLFKLTYQAILDHSGDEHLVARAVGSLASVAEPDERFRLLIFGVDHFFLMRPAHRQLRPLQNRGRDRRHGSGPRADNLAWRAEMAIAPSSFNDSSRAGIGHQRLQPRAGVRDTLSRAH